MTSLLETGEHSDLVLRCSEGKEFKVHKAILCAQSEFFQKACKPGSFKVSQPSIIKTRVETKIILFQEAKENVVKLTIGDSSLISLLLSFLYTTGCDYEDSLLTDVNLYVAADFYDIESLKAVAAEKFKDHLTKGLWKSDSFSQAVEIIYNETTAEMEPDLRGIALEKIVEHASELMKSDTNGAPSALAKVMDRVAELSKDLAMRLLSENEKLKSATPATPTKDDKDPRIKVTCSW